MRSADSENRIQGLSTLQPVSVLNAYVLGHGYSLWPEDLTLVGNTQLIEKSLIKLGASPPNLDYSITLLQPDQTLLAFRLHWPKKILTPTQPNLHFWHAVLCNTPRSEASALALSELALSLLAYYDANYEEIGERLRHIAQTPVSASCMQPSWSESFFRLPHQLPSSLTSQARDILTGVFSVTKLVAPDSLLKSPTPTRLQRMLPATGWLVSAVLLVVLILVLSLHF